MKIRAHYKRIFPVLDTLLERWQHKQFPYNRKQAVVPQRLIPDALRKNRESLCCFYFYACIYMRGGIVSSQAFRALLRMRAEHMDMFDPFYAQWLDAREVQKILKQYIGWDSAAAAVNWVENSRRLMQYWDGNPLNILYGLRSYNEAVRRIRNKRTKKDRLKAGTNGLGFRGFQYKMVSMFIYFCDWEGWLEKRFLYPAPADFHNFRIALAHRGITLHPQRKWIRSNEKLSEVWRRIVMRYLRSRSADPVELADAIWLFSLVLCGNSPLTQHRARRATNAGMFAHENLPNEHELALMSSRYRSGVMQTCLRCPILSTCELAIPAGPYYQRGRDEVGFSRGGKLLLQPRFPAELYLGTLSPDAGDTKSTTIASTKVPMQTDMGWPESRG